MRVAFLKCRSVFAAVAIAIVVTYGLAGGSPARANEDPPPNNSSNFENETVTVQMQGDCQSLDSRAKRYAIKHGICPAGVRGGLTSMSGQTFNCGTATIIVRNYGHRGFGWIYYGFSSSWGRVISRTLAVSWAGSSDQGGFSDNSGMFATSYYKESTSKWMGPGWVTAVLSGGVTVFWGATCKIPPLAYTGTV